MYYTVKTENSKAQSTSPHRLISIVSNTQARVSISSTHFHRRASSRVQALLQSLPSSTPSLLLTRTLHLLNPNFFLSRRSGGGSKCSRSRLSHRSLAVAAAAAMESGVFTYPEIAKSFDFTSEDVSTTDPNEYVVRDRETSEGIYFIWD
ncbi:hypothetical protein Syun_000976 [Stephania yunnanensis]|uniref:Uncharacterized protein n=1 Tax=Stephania yunnanensis TaxID=152371 RepID=A0AAP0QAF3_9MAGN